MTETDVIILNWNGLAFLKQYLPVLIEHTPPDEARIVVADNGSTDDSLKWLIENYKTEVKLIKLDKNYGFAGGYNKALEQTSSTYAVLLNSDVEVSKGWLSPLRKALEDDSVAAVMPKIKAINQRKYFEYAGACGGYIDKWGFPFCRGRILDELEKDTGQYDHIEEVFWTSGACMMIKTDLFKKAGGFDEDFFAHMEEIDLCWRLKSMSYKLLAVPQSTVYHLGGGTLPSGNHRKVYLNFRNSLLTLYKNLPHGRTGRILFIRMILDGIAALLFLLQGKTKSFSAVIKAHITFYKMKKDYREIRKSKKAGEPDITGLYKKSILFDYFIRGKRKYSEL